MANETSRYSGLHPQVLPFPPEIVVLILGYLDYACDKRSARLACKGFGAAGLSSLTSTINFSTSLIDESYFSNVLHISSPTLEIAMHPVVSKYVTRLVCYGTLLPITHLQIRVFQNWWRNLGRNPTSVQNIHSGYVSKFDQEKRMIGRGDDRMILCTALQRCLKLNCIVITDVALDEHLQPYPRPEWPSAPPAGDL